MNYFGTIHDIPAIQGAVIGYLKGTNLLSQQWQRKEEAMQTPEAAILEDTDRVLYSLAACCQGIGNDSIQQIIDAIDAEELSQKGRDFLLSLIHI